MKLSTSLAVSAAFASTVLAAPKPHSHHHHHDVVTKAYVNDAAYKITKFVKHHVHKEWPKPDVVARNDAAEDIAIATNPLDEPVVEVVLVMVEITEVVNKEHHKRNRSQDVDEVTTGASVEEKIEGKVVPRGWWPFGKKGDDKKDNDKKEATGPTSTIPWYKEPKKYDILHVLDHTVTVGPMVTPTLAVMTIPVINVQTKSKHGHTPTTLTKTNFITTTVSQAPTETVDPRLDVWSKDEAIKAAVGTVEVMLGGAVFAGASAGATYVGKIGWNVAKSLVGKIW